MTDEWPKPWGEIKPEPEGDKVIINAATQYVDISPVRCYQDTVYINAGGGEPTDDDNRDLWLPLGVYLRNGGEIDA